MDYAPAHTREVMAKLLSDRSTFQPVYESPGRATIYRITDVARAFTTDGNDKPIAD